MTPKTKTCSPGNARPYRPSNGSEGEGFEAQFCNRCTRDQDFRDNDGDSCQILAAVHAWPISDPNYPKEWVTDDKKGARCTAFTTGPLEPARCDRTLEMFPETVA